MKFGRVTGIILVLLFASTLAFDIQPARTEPTTWTVDDNGAADFHTIQEAVEAASGGDTIQVASGIYYGCVRIDNKTLSLMGEDRDTTIIDGNVTETCISMQESRNMMITGFTLRNSQAQQATNNAGIWAYRCPNINVTDNLIVNNQDGIHLWSSDGGTVVGNMITENSRHGIWLENSGDNTLRNNTINGNQYNFRVGLDYVQDIDVSNLVDGGPIVYLVNESDVEVRDAGLAVAINCTNITIENLNLANNYEGILFVETHDSTIRQTTISSNWHGVYLFYSDDNELDNNVITRNLWGIESIDSYGNIVEGNTICHNTHVGTYLFESVSIFHHNNFINNTEHVKEEWEENSWFEGNYWEGEVYTGDPFPLSRPWGLLGSGDINLDGVVDIFDIVLVANAFDSEPGEPSWNPMADLNNDRVVDIFDIVTVANNFGKTA